jgi:hypothetical protein
MLQDYLEVNLYVIGRYRGKRRVGKNSIIGRLLTGDLDGAMARIREMKRELERIPGVEVKPGPGRREGENGGDDGN